MEKEFYGFIINGDLSHLLLDLSHTESNEQASIPSYGCSNNNDNNNNSNTERNSVTISSCGGSASSTSSTSHIREQSPTITMNNLNR